MLLVCETRLLAEPWEIMEAYLSSSTASTKGASIIDLGTAEDPLQQFNRDTSPQKTKYQYLLRLN